MPTTHNKGLDHTMNEPTKTGTRSLDEARAQLDATTARDRAIAISALENLARQVRASTEAIAASGRMTDKDWFDPEPYSQYTQVREALFESWRSVQDRLQALDRLLAARAALAAIEPPAEEQPEETQVAEERPGPWGFS